MSQANAVEFEAELGGVLRYARWAVVSDQLGGRSESGGDICVD
jgi:hypothetical protein